MGSGASKKSPTNQTPRTPGTARRQPTTSRGNFQEVEFQASGQGRPVNMSSRPQQPDPRTSATNQQNKYTRYSNANNPQHHGQSSRDGRRSNSPIIDDEWLQQKVVEIKANEPEIKFENFVHQNGREFVCATRAGKRYYLDNWHSHDWQLFPERWYNEGTLIPIDSANYEPSQNDRDTEDDRQGHLQHPKRGKIQTYLMEERHYVHYFFDKTTGKWLRLPIGWELHHELVKQMVDYVEETLPKWKDRADILALLRVCNYSPDECIGTYLLLEDDDWLLPQKTSKQAQADEMKDEKIQELTEKIHKLESELLSEKRAREEAEKQLSELVDKYSKISADATSAQHQVEAMQHSRPKTARPKTPIAVVPLVSEKDLEDLNQQVKNLHKAHVRLKMDMLRNVGSVSAVIKDAIKAAGDLKKSDVGSKQELEEIRSLYQKEALQRKLLYNQLQELRGNIRVFCRPRKDDRGKNCLSFPSDQDITVTNQDGVRKTFSFDKVYTPESTQDTIFKDTQPIIASCVDGYNVCLLAYGQTGSGKTFTMMGPDSNPGINIRAITELLKVCSNRAETKNYTLKVSMVEIYNEAVLDLLTEETKTLELSMVGNSVKIPNIMEMPVNEVKDIKEVMKLGDSNRKTASTKMNSTSSRSHLVLMVTVEGEDKVTGAFSRGVLTLCDLAGSERISKTEATGQRLVEAAAINKSLSALGQVFSALRESQLHIPYRNSKLTQILRPCLGGDAKACLFVNISPDISNCQETINTLDFGGNARQVALGQAKQNIQKKGGGGFPPR